MPTATLTAIRVQRLDTLEWFNWNNGVWDKTPKITLGQNLYVSAYCVNWGTEGTITMRFRRASDNIILMSDSSNVLNSGSMGLEMTDYTITTAQSIIVETEPGDSVTFDVVEDVPTPPECPTGYHYDPVSQTCVQDVVTNEIPWWLIGLAGGLFVATWLVINKMHD